MTAVEWMPSEWAEGGSSAEMGGVVADVFPDFDPLPGYPWAWVVKVTSAVSEYPELWSCGGNKTEAAAKRSAETALKRAAQYYRGSKGAQA